jgi:ketosteroid isomerase-like protein
VEADANVQVVEKFLTAFNRHRLDRLVQLTTRDQSMRLPDGTAAQGRLAVARLIVWVVWRSRGTLRMAPLSVLARGESEVVARTRNSARRGDVTLGLDMVLVFTVREGRVSAIQESVEDLASWRSFWRQPREAPE